MLSLKKNIKRLDLEDQLFQAALGAYVSAIAVIRNLPLATDAESLREYKEALREIEIQLTDARDAEVLDRSREALRQLVDSYRAKAEVEAARKEEDLRAVMVALEEATQVLSEQHAGQSLRLDTFSERLQDSAKLSDLGQMRRRITHQVRELKEIAEKTKRENDATVSGFRSQLVEFSARLDSAERRASLDALTGLLNRGAGETRLQTLIESGQGLTAVLVDLNSFKKINDTWGHAAGDQVLKTTGRILANFFRPGDLVCRWGGDEFLAVLTCSENTIRERVAILDTQIRTPQKIVVMSKVFEVTVSASVGIATRREGESGADFISRVDADMYKRKGCNLLVVA